VADLQPVDFDDPPVVETVLSVRFRELPGFGLAQIVEFWQRFLQPELSQVEERPRYEVPLERFGEASDPPPLTLQFGSGIPTPRLWFTGGSKLVQLQPDWFAYNWRRTSPSDDYTRYTESRQTFGDWLARLSAFFEGLGGKLFPVQCEVTYVNHIPLLAEDLAIGPLGDVLKNITPKTGDFLPAPESGRYSASYVMDGAQGHGPLGRLHLTAERAWSSGKTGPLMVVNLTARGAPVGDGIDGVLAFSDLGHDWVVRGFKDATSPSLHRRWGLRNGE
jgi:uncharacterized protein (TIGR04255 family)